MYLILHSEAPKKLRHKISETKQNLTKLNRNSKISYQQNNSREKCQNSLWNAETVSQSQPTSTIARAGCYCLIHKF